MRKLLVACMALFPLSLLAASAPVDSPAQFREAGGFAMQADMKSALPHLLRVQPSKLSDAQRAVWSCMRERFVAKRAVAIPADLDAWTADVLAIYRRYWMRAMLDPASAPARERELFAALSNKVRHDASVKDMDALEPLLQTQLEARGHRALFGLTRPLREFMLWRKQSDETYDIELPQGHEAVHVAMMDDFVSYGWLGYATCDYRHTGGWATPERLFAVRSAYDLESESFRVSYLAHEGQHFADYRRFPELQQPELEYRAKLVEIAKARTTLFDLLAGFTANGSDDRALPHPWANRQVVNNLATRLHVTPSAETWQRFSVEQLNAAAAQLLAQDSQQRGAAK